MSDAFDATMTIEGRYVRSDGLLWPRMVSDGERVRVDAPANTLEVRCDRGTYPPRMVWIPAEAGVTDLELAAIMRLPRDQALARDPVQDWGSFRAFRLVTHG